MAVIRIADYDPQWPASFERERNRIQAALGRSAQVVEHVGSTSVSGLAAKPIIDILLVVEDSANEAAYAPPLEAAGYTLRIREPEWHQHRMFIDLKGSVNLHVFSLSCPEIERMLRFRDWLRGSSADRELYGATKLELAQKQWDSVQDYANAKTAVVEGVLARALAPSHP